MECHVIAAEATYADECLRKACIQVALLNSEINRMRFQLENAKRNDQRTRGYQLRLRLTTIEGVRNMYYEYATRKAAMVLHLKSQLTDQDGYELFLDDSDDSDTSADV